MCKFFAQKYNNIPVLGMTANTTTIQMGWAYMAIRNFAFKIDNKF